MADSAVQYLPFESVWKMQIDHPYSLFVRDADLYWSCGQCPLNEQGQVQSPNDLVAQATLVCGFIERFLSEIHCNIASVGQLIVYYVETTASTTATTTTTNIDNDAGETLQELFHHYFGPDVIVLTIAIPHFYYDGMMIEVDVFGSTALETGKQARTFSIPSVNDESLTKSALLNVLDVGQLKWARLLVPKSSSTSLNMSLKDATSRLLQEAGLSFDRLLSEQWFVRTGNTEPANDIQSMRSSKSNLKFNNCQIVETTNHNDFDIVGQFTFSASAPVLRQSDAIANDHVVINTSQAGDFFEIMGTCHAEHVGLVEQTRRIMLAIDKTIQEKNSSFGNVRKVTTYYVGGSSAEELHDNMSVRNKYYSKPGPASTGLPVQAFPLAPEARISIRVFGKCS